MTQRRKDRIKNIAIIFLAVLLVLTLFSQTFMNYTLPEVATQAVQPGQISPKVRGTGTVEADDPYNIMVEETRKISSVAVKVGDKVKKDAVIYYLEDKQSKELEDAEKTLDEMETAYEKGLFSGTLSDSVITRLRNGMNDTADGYQYRLRLLQEQYKAAEDAVLNLQIADAALALQQQVLTSNQAWTDAERQYDSLTPNYSIADLEKELANPDTSSDRKAEIQSMIANYNQDISQWNNETAQVDQHFAAEQAGIAYQQAFADYQQALAGFQLTTAEKEKADKLAELLLEIDLVSQQEQMAKQRQKIEDLKKKAVGATVISPVEGTVTSLALTAGEETDPESPAAVIQVDGKPMSTHFSVTTEQAKNLKVGDAAEAQNAWFYTDFKATLSAIKPDSSDPAGHKQLYFTIQSPEVQAGQSVSLQIGEAAKQYEMTVPNSAIREDNNGKFVLLLQSKSSPLGNRYKAQRADVQVIAQDDKITAISGAFDSWSYVITTTTAPVKAGDQVRLSNENT
ncbi:MAG: hypothetical protein J5935_04535 [Lachnospiraceae bacterium]|nr:hypothetical protein [Lachnospiraceae bacterium]